MPVSVSLRSRPAFLRIPHVAAAAMLLCAAAVGSARAEAPRSNVVSFTTSAIVEVPQDLLSVTLAVVRDGMDAAAVQAGLKQVLEGALAEARKSAKPTAFEVRTGNFSLYPRYGRDGKINGWQGSAELVLEGTDVAKVGQVSGKLAGMNVTNVSYGLSRGLRESHETQLTKDAIGRFRARAAELAANFGFPAYDIGEVNVQSDQSGGGRPVPMMRAAKAESFSADAALPVEPGKGTITVTVSGSVILKR